MESSTLLSLILVIDLVIISGKLVANNINNNGKQDTAVKATEVYECEVMYGQQFSPKNFRNSVPKLSGETMPGELHSMYISEVVWAWRK